MAIQCVLVPTDFSSDAAAALELAIELARPGGAALHLLHSGSLGPYLSGFPEPISIPVEFVERVRAEARTQLEELAKRVAAAGLPCTTHVSDSEPVRAILHYAESLKADLIAMGTRGLTGLRHALLGSVAERTVRLAPCPVLTVQARDGASPDRRPAAALTRGTSPSAS